MEDKILKLLGRKGYTPCNVPQLLERLRLPPNQPAGTARSAPRTRNRRQILRTKGNRYIQSREADLVPGVLRINRQGKGWLHPDDPALGEITVPESATSTAMHGDRRAGSARRRAAGTPPASAREETGAVVRILERKRSRIVGTLREGRQFLFRDPG